MSTLRRQARTSEGANAATSARTLPLSQPAAERRPAGTHRSTSRHLRAYELPQGSLSPAGDENTYRHRQTDSDQAQAQRASNRAAAEFHSSSLLPGGLRPFRSSGTSGSVSPRIAPIKAASRPPTSLKGSTMGGMWVAPFSAPTRPPRENRTSSLPHGQCVLPGLTGPCGDTPALTKGSLLSLRLALRTVGIWLVPERSSLRICSNPQTPSPYTVGPLPAPTPLDPESMPWHPEGVAFITCSTDCLHLTGPRTV
jgi:hypothetical protein